MSRRDTHHKRILTEHLDVLQDRVYFGADLEGSLISKNIITWEEKDDISAHSSAKKKIMNLIDVIKRKPLSAFHDFLMVGLKSSGNQLVAEMLENEEREWAVDMAVPDQETKHFILSSFLDCSRLEQSEKKTLYSDLILKTTFLEEKHARQLAEKKAESLHMKVYSLEHQLEETSRAHEQVVADKLDQIARLKSRLLNNEANASLQEQLRTTEAARQQMEGKLKRSDEIKQILNEDNENKSKLVKILTGITCKLAKIGGNEAPRMSLDMDKELESLQEGVDNIERKITDCKEREAVLQKEILQLQAREKRVRHALGVSVNASIDVIAEKVQKLLSENESKAEKNETLLKELQSSSEERKQLQDQCMCLTRKIISLEMDKENMKKCLVCFKQKFIDIEAQRHTCMSARPTDDVVFKARKFVSRSPEKVYCVVCHTEFTCGPCWYHQSPFKGGKWTCCGKLVVDAKGCTEGEHICMDSKPKLRLTTENSM